MSEAIVPRRSIGFAATVAKRPIDKCRNLDKIAIVKEERDEGYSKDLADDSERGQEGFMKSMSD